uniref:Uncharacterized protein n=1 Tax=Aegilops tauschii subsp. strangulata TaxID=200361 RepID=A0A453GVP6_AEGTS
ADLGWGRGMEGDDKWKLSKKGRSRSGRNYYYGDASGSGASTSGGLSRSYSASVTATASPCSSAGATTSSGRELPTFFQSFASALPLLLL